MSLAENLLNSLDETAYQNSRIAGIEPEEEHIIVGQDRVITVPNNLKTIAVKGDKDIETVTIDCVRYWDGHDLSTFAIYINYILPNGDEGTYIAKNITKLDDIFTFEWEIGSEITYASGKLTFWIVAKLTADDADATLIKQWSSFQNSECNIAQGGDKIYVPEKQTDQDVISQAIAVSRDSAERAEAAAERAEETADLDFVELPQEWVDINEAYEDFGEPGHRLMGGLIYKDFDGNIKVYPLSPAYGVRFDECGFNLPSVVVYNSAQQILVKPATEGRHTVCLRQLDEFFGGGSTSDLGEKASSLQKIPPVDLTPPINERKPYVFCRDSQNHFAPKYYSEAPHHDEIAERDPAGRLRANAPDSGSPIYDDHLVNVDYLTRILNQNLRKYLPLSGGTMTGTHTIQKNNPALKLIDTSNNTTSYVQLYRDRLRMGYTWSNSLAVDKDGNAEVYGDLTVGGSVSCNTPTKAEHAVNLEYLNNKIAELYGTLPTITSADELDSILTNATASDVGKAYKYIGETTSKYENNAIYVVKEN